MNTMHHVLLPVSSAQDAVQLLPLATAIARAWRQHVFLMGIVAVAPNASLSTGAMAAQDLRQALSRLAGADSLVDMLPTAKVSHTPWQEIEQWVAEALCDLLLLRWPPDSNVFGCDLREVLMAPPCDVAVVRPGEPMPPRSIFLPVRGGPHAELALRVSLALAESFGIEITALHAAPVAPSRADIPYVDLLPVLEQLAAVSRVVTVYKQAPGAIVAEAKLHDLLVMGATAQPQAQPIAIGPITDRVIREAPGTAIAVKTRRKMVFAEDLPPTIEAAPASQAAISVLVDKWFAENSFHSREFEDLDALVEMKQARGLTISLGLPSLNEEETVGQVISVCKQELMENVPLLDEIVLIDSRSTDRTREIARDLDIPVYVHQEILPQYGLIPGKGEALWKSLHVLQGDIIAWIDTDITNIDPRFVYGLLGPLLREPRIQYVKGFYRRPLQVGDKLQAGGGGRVTELVARPMFNLFYPELSGLVQPLSGEYAGRRQALEQLPFSTGYGVETGLLIDMLDKFGLSAIAQVDLEERIHKNQELTALSKMSFQILQVFVRRLEARHGPMLAEVNKTMKLVQHEYGQFYLDIEDIRELERPPMTSIPEYRPFQALSAV